MEKEIVIKQVTHRLPVCGILGVAFIVLKLCGVIGWSWWWVLAPFWGPVALLLAVLLGLVALLGVAMLGAVLLSKWSDRSERKEKELRRALRDRGEQS